MPIDTYIYAKREGKSYTRGGPLFFVFHSAGATETQFLDLAAELLPEALIIAPRGDVSQQGVARFLEGSEKGAFDPEEIAKRSSQIRGFVQAHITANDPSMVMGLGYSDGAGILAGLIDMAPDLFSHVVLMHPQVPWSLGTENDMIDLRVMITAGGRDATSPPYMIETIADMLEARGAIVESHWHAGGHEIAHDELEAIRQWSVAQRAAQEDPEELTIERSEEGNRGRYFMRSASGVEAEMRYTLPFAGRMIIDHTEVPDAFRGKGIGKRLFDQLVEDARAVSVTIIPLCPFAAAQFRRDPSLADVLDTSFKPKKSSGQAD